MRVQGPRRLFSPEELRAWRHPRPVRLFWDLFSIWLQVVLGCALYVLVPHPLTLVVSWLIVGGGQHCMGLVAHEGCHNLLVPKNRQANDSFVSFLFASPVGLPFFTYRDRHLQHHRAVCLEDDSKRLYRRSFVGVRMLWEVLRSLSGWDFFGTALKVVGKDMSPSSKNSHLDFRRLVGVQVTLLLIFSIWDYRLYFLLWFYPMVSFAQLFSKFRSAVEHRPLESQAGGCGPYYLGLDHPCLRTVTARPWECLFLSRLNFHFHAEHHLWPQVSYQYLPEVHRRLREFGPVPGVVFDESYSAALAKLWRGE